MLGFAGGTPADLRKYGAKLGYGSAEGEADADIFMCASEVPEVFERNLGVVLAAVRASARPWAAHLFSKAGFLSLARLLKRLDKPRKRWKFDPSDIENWRGRDRYLALVNETLTATHTDHAPWHLIPNDDKPAARARVAGLVADSLAALAPEYPRENIGCIEHYKALLRGDSHDGGC